VEYGCFCGGLGGEPILGSFFPFLYFILVFGSSAQDGIVFRRNSYPSSRGITLQRGERHYNCGCECAECVCAGEEFVGLSLLLPFPLPSTLINKELCRQREGEMKMRGLKYGYWSMIKDSRFFLSLCFMILRTR
jgi:hypothetical protein